MRLLAKRRCRGDGSGNQGAAALAALPVSPVEDEQGPLVGGPEVGDSYSVGTDFCFRMPDLRRLDEEVDELMGSSDVPTTRRTHACTSEKMSVREAAAAVTLPVKHVSAFAVFLENLPRKEELPDGAWFIQSCKCWQQRDRRSKRSLAKQLLGARFGTLQVFFFLSRRYMMDTVTWTADQLK